MKDRQIETYKAVQKSENDLLNKMGAIAQTMAAEIDSKMHIINDSLRLIEQNLSHIFEEMANLAGYILAQNQEQAIRSTLIDAILYANLKALDLRTTYVN